jgi:hypothetical protein
VHSTRAFSTPYFSFFHRCSVDGVRVTAPAQLDQLKNTTPEQRPKTQTEFMKLKLDLTPDQPRKVTHTVVKWVKRLKVEFIGDR